MAHILGIFPSPGTRRWKDMGTKEVFIRVHVRVCLNPYDTVPNFSRGTLNWNVGPITEPLEKLNLIIQNKGGSLAHSVERLTLDMMV